MNVEEAYNQWAGQYDAAENKTRDVEAAALRHTLDGQTFQRCLEIGCGTGKNTVWLVQVANEVTAVDFSEAMLAQAKEKLSNKAVNFHQADITKDWSFGGGMYDLITFSLVLEHIENLDDVLAKAAAVAAKGATVYIGELHPFKQYMGSRARFATPGGEQIVTCYQHHVSDFVQAAKRTGFLIENITEWFDIDARELPRILCLTLKYKGDL